MTSDFWTGENLEACRALWVERGRTARQIAAEVGDGCTKNMVIGMARRQSWRRTPEAIALHRQACAEARGLPAQGTKPKRQERVIRFVPRPPSAGVRKGTKLPPMGDNLPANAAPVAFRLRTPCQCAWPIDAPEDLGTADALACGAPIDPDGPRSYCTAHAARAYRQEALHPLDGLAAWVSFRESSFARAA